MKSLFTGWMNKLWRDISPMARMEAIQMFLEFSTHKDFKVYQMDVKPAFLNGELEEDVYMEQLEGF